MIKWVCLGIGGLSGTFLRYILSKNIDQTWGTHFPYGTLIVNLIGCFFIGFFVVLADKKFLLDANAKLLLVAGFCGAFTTFSTFMFETSNLITMGGTLRALANVLISVVAGFCLFRLGVLVGELF